MQVEIPDTFSGSFIINVCGFQVVEFFNQHHTENDSDHEGEEYFRFVKYINK